jgi:hypothetical protein
MIQAALPGPLQRQHVGLRIGERPLRRVDHGRKARQDGCIQRIRFRQLARRLGNVSAWARIDRDHGQGGVH